MLCFHPISHLPSPITFSPILFWGFGIVFLRYVLTIFYNIFDRCDLLRSPARLSIFPLFPFERASDRASFVCVRKTYRNAAIDWTANAAKPGHWQPGGELSLPSCCLVHCLKLSAGDQRPTSWQTLEFPPHDHSAKWSRVCGAPTASASASAWACAWVSVPYDAVWQSCRHSHRDKQLWHAVSRSLIVHRRKSSIVSKTRFPLREIDCELKWGKITRKYNH